MHVKVSEVFHYLGKAILGHLVHSDCILVLLTLTLQMEVACSSKTLPTQCTSTWCQQSKIQSISHFHIMLF